MENLANVLHKNMSEWMLSNESNLYTKKSPAYAHKANPHLTFTLYYDYEITTNSDVGVLIDKQLLYLSFKRHILTLQKKKLFRNVAVITKLAYYLHLHL